MWTIFLDIDGTLLRTNGAGLEAIKVSVKELFGAEIELPNVAVHGRTDAGILKDLFRGQTFDWQARLPELLECYSRNLRIKMQQKKGMVYPGVVDFLEALLKRKKQAEGPENSFAIGLLTGNCRLAALAKIEHFGLSKYVEGFGGFGDDYPDRNDVAASARESAAVFLGEQFNPEKMWVIGDTPNDIHCGRSIGARVMAVATGGSTLEELSSFNPEICVADLAEPSLVEQLFLP